MTPPDPSGGPFEGADPLGENLLGQNLLGGSARTLDADPEEVPGLDFAAFDDLGFGDLDLGAPSPPALAPSTGARPRPAADDGAARRALEALAERAARVRLRPVAGRLVGVTGALLRAEVRGARVGELCEVADPSGSVTMMAEVVAIDGGASLLAPFGPAVGLSARSQVTPLGRVAEVAVGDHLLGAVLDGFGRLTQPGPAGPPRGATARRPLRADPPGAMARRPIRLPFETGVRCIDGLMTLAEGQRVGIFGNAGAGKSSLLAEIIQNADIDVAVLVLVGERGREVGELLAHIGPKGRARSVMVAATSDRPPIERLQASYVGTAVAEHFRDQGKRVLLLVDSVTRLARALRDVGLAAGEPPTRRGFTPSVFNALPSIFERAGMGEVGSITAIYTVLVEGEMNADPIAEETVSLLDGHIVLSQKLGAMGHYPAIDPLESKSRLMNAIADPDHRHAAVRVKGMMARHREVELLIQVGEYRRGGDAATDEAVDRIDAINAFLRQPQGDPSSLAATVAALEALAA